MSNITIRPFDGSDTDYEHWVAVQHAVYPDYKTSVAEIKDNDVRRPSICRNARWLAFRDGQPVGLAAHDQVIWVYNPDRYIVEVLVAPEARKAGLGSALYEIVINALAAFHPKALRVVYREGADDSLRFLKKRAYTELERAWESRLDVTAFDFAPFAEAQRKAAENGIVIRSVAELQQTEPEEWARKVYEVDRLAVQDVPSQDGVTPPDFETYKNQAFEGHNFIPEAFFVAVDTSTGNYVGTSSLFKTDGEYLNVGFTGTHPEYRRKGIAMTLKLAAVEYAKCVGCPEIRTDNDSTNQPMLSINVALGFVRQPAWIWMAKDLTAA